MIASEITLQGGRYASKKSRRKKNNGRCEAWKTAAKPSAKKVKAPSKTRKPAAKTAKRTAPGKAAAAKTPRYGCEVCGLVVSVDEWGEMNIVNLVCCGEQMQPE
ncbi:MAG: hypothetical protein M0033_07610 [Nitrospiraceae bacterium]|nr:hypothetical protein [Nitrospiraceae bacterium]